MVVHPRGERLVPKSVDPISVMVATNTNGLFNRVTAQYRANLGTNFQAKSQTWLSGQFGVVHPYFTSSSVPSLNGPMGGHFLRRLHPTPMMANFMIPQRPTANSYPISMGSNPANYPQRSHSRNVVHIGGSGDCADGGDSLDHGRRGGHAPNSRWRIQRTPKSHQLLPQNYKNGAASMSGHRASSGFYYSNIPTESSPSIHRFPSGTASYRSPVHRPERNANMVVRSNSGESKDQSDCENQDDSMVRIRMTDDDFAPKCLACGLMASDAYHLRYHYKTKHKGFL